METSKLVVIISGLLGIIFTYWFFLGKKEKEIQVIGKVDISVSGGYSPEVISIPKGQTTTINFLRTDPSDCLSEVVLSDFKIRKELPLNKKVSIKLTPQKEGEFKFTCGMNMYHGKIVVK
ncbi:cupredoxin domain-containing protein [Patescibacteria group bacterium]|nr:cupredoxin domain-containing protein [Patescibacteria group bacterium]